MIGPKLRWKKQQTLKKYTSRVDSNTQILKPGNGAILNQSLIKDRQRELDQLKPIKWQTV